MPLGRPICLLLLLHCRFAKRAVQPAAHHRVRLLLRVKGVQLRGRLRGVYRRGGGGAGGRAGGLLVAAALAYYFLLQPAFGIGMALFLLPALALAHWVGRQSWGVVAAVFFALFIGGWILQLIGHAVFEKRRPALTDNLFQMVIGPIFLVAELFFLCGYRPGLHDRIRELSHRHDPA